MKAIKSFIALLGQTFDKWNEHQAVRLSAAVAFYALFSMAPLLIFITALIAVVVSQQAAQNYLIHAADQIVGSRGGDLVHTLLTATHRHSSGIFPTIIAFVTLLFGASGIFCELRDAMNTIWDVRAKSSAGWQAVVLHRLFSFGMVLSVGFLLMVSLILSTLLAFVGKHFIPVFPLPPEFLELINFFVSLGIITFLFALIFKFVPSIRIPWRDVLVGALGTALLFTVGKFLLGLYLGRASVGSAYGAAGSVVALIVWVYYSAQIFFFGAEFTRVYSDARAEHRRRLRGTKRQHSTESQKALGAGA